jgi:hypothetical protein
MAAPRDPAPRPRSVPERRTEVRSEPRSLAVVGRAPAGREEHRVTVSPERQELICSVVGLVVKVALVAVAGVSLYQLAGAYRERMDRQGEISAVIELETARLAKARERFDQLFTTEGEHRLIREQSQWIAPNRLRVVWQKGNAFPTVETARARPETPTAHP